MFPEILSFTLLITILFSTPKIKFYESAFLSVMLPCLFMTWKQYNSHVPKKIPKDSKTTAEAKKFNLLFLTVYCLVMASDWLQGPYVYSLYKDQFGFKEEVVAALFTTGFLSGGISGYFVGQFADRCGRKAACLLFCCTYSLACFSTLLPNLFILFLGRIFGGLSASLMYSAFESWMVTEFHKRKLGTSLSNMLGLMTTLNSVVAILAGVGSEWLVRFTDTTRAPFMASAGLLFVAGGIIWLFWSENYGDSKLDGGSNNPAQNVLKRVVTDKRIMTLALASCFFEGSMYLFVFFWSPALKAAQLHNLSSGEVPNLPYGTIFASFMGSMMLGSLLFSYLSRFLPVPRLLTLTFALAALSLSIPILQFPPSITISREAISFWSFCFFEACVGIYFPSIGYLKGKYIDDGIRARVYGMLRIPLNVFVVSALALVQEGEAYRNTVFGVCSGMLLVASAILFSIVGE